MKKALATFAFVAFTAAAASAQVLIWDVSGDTSPASLTADTIDVGLATTPGLNALTREGTLGNPGTVNSFAGNTWNLTNVFDETTKYFTFSLQATAGNQVTLTSLQFSMNGSNSAPANGLWGYSIGGGAFTLQPQFSNTFAITTSTWDFNDFTTTQSVEFRFWAFGASSITGGTSLASGSMRISNAAGNDLILNGSVGAVPEPATFGLIGLGLLGTWAFAYRRSRKS